MASKLTDKQCRLLERVGKLGEIGHLPRTEREEAALDRLVQRQMVYRVDRDHQVHSCYYILTKAGHEYLVNTFGNVWSPGSTPTASIPFYYNADFYCLDCGKRLTLQEEFPGGQLAPAQETQYRESLRGGLHTGDISKHWPIHCAAGEECLNAIEVDGGRIGCLLDYPLDEHGLAYVRDKIQCRDGHVVLLETWERHFGTQLGRISKPNNGDIKPRHPGGSVPDGPANNPEPGKTITEQIALGLSRVGQGLFREGLLKLWGDSCAVTGLDLPALLRASHIKPWKDSDDAERLDPYNGLLLSPTYDAAFDRGLLTFDDEGVAIVSRELTSSRLQGLGLDPDARIRNLDSRHKYYLSYHIINVFQSKNIDQLKY